MRDRLNGIILAAVFSAVVYFSLAPVESPPLSDTFLPIALLWHLSFYFLLAGALLLHFHGKKYGHLEAVIIAGLTGVLLEVLQHPLPHRSSFQILDVVVNFIGASVVMFERRIPVIHRVVEFEDKLLERALKDERH